MRDLSHPKIQTTQPPPAISISNLNFEFEPRHLLKQKDALGEVGSKGITELGLLEGKAPLVVLQPHTPTLLAFEQLATAGGCKEGDRRASPCFK